jgi:hypothetical protein
MIAELGEPDMLVKNPHWRSGPMSSLYSIARVEAWCDQNAERLTRAQEERVRRSARMTEVVRRRRDELLTWAAEVEIGVNYPLPADLHEQAWRWYAWHDYQRGIDRGEYDTDDVYNGHVSHGGLVAYVRHNHTNYERLLERLERQPGGVDAYLIIKRRVNESVEAALMKFEQVETGEVAPDVMMREIGAPTLPGMEL